MIFRIKSRLVGLISLILASVCVIAFVPAVNKDEISRISGNESDVSSNIEIKKAIIIIPGITGSDLLTDEVYTGNGGTLINEGEAIWIPQRVSDLFESLISGGEVDSSFFSLDTILYLNACVSMLKSDSNGEPLYNIIPKSYDKSKGYGILGTATRLYNSLDKEFSDEYDVIFFSYDWRLSISENALLLEELIERNSYKENVFVCHSMGGLIASYYLQASQENIDATDKLITLGTPFGGSPRALMALQFGRFFDSSVTDMLIKEITYNMSSVYELLPGSEFIDDNGGYIYNNGKLLNSAETEDFISSDIRQSKNDDIGGLNKRLYSNALNEVSRLYSRDTHIINNTDIDVYMIAGYNTPTVDKIYQEDALVSQVSKSYAGDGTVPLSSAVSFNGGYYDNPIYFANGIKHSEILFDRECISLVADLIKNGNNVNINDHNRDKFKTKEEVVLKNDDELEPEDITLGLLNNIFKIAE